MFTSIRFRSMLLISIALLTFVFWFADGYFQWVNSDTAGDAYALAQDVAFPRALFSDHEYHSRVTSTILAYIPFHTVGYLYRELSGDPVSALYVSQGVMTGMVFLLLMLISAAYVSMAAPMLSSRYLISAALLMLFGMCLPLLQLNNPLSLTLRFGHQSVMCHYVGAMTLALFVLFPFWRRMFTGKWNDWHDNATWRAGFYLLLLAAVFSSTVIMVWLGFIAFFAVVAIVHVTAKRHGKNGRIAHAAERVFKNSSVYPLALTLILFVVAVFAESMTTRGRGSFARTDLLEYVKVFPKFFFSGSMLWGSLICILLLALIVRKHKQGSVSWRLRLSAKIFPWLMIANLAFVFVIGMPRVRYRFGGYNLGPDTVLPALWSVALWIMAVLLEFWRENKLTWLAPLLAFMLITNSLTFLDFSPRFYAYQYREKQKSIFLSLYHADQTVPMDVELPLPVENVAFTRNKLNKYTIPMLRKMGIISLRRRVSVVSQEAYDSWYTDFLKGALAEAQVKQPPS